MSYLIPLAFAVWVVLVWFSPMLLIRGARPPVIGSIPGTFLQGQLWANHVSILEADEINHPGGAYALSFFFGFRRVIVVNAIFWRFAAPDAKKFLLAHELGHHVLGHVLWRLLAVIFLVWWLAPVRRRLQFTEHEADDYATKLTGLPTTVLWGPTVISTEETLP